MADRADFVRVGKEGNRWYNERPNGEAIADWFSTAVEMPDELKPESYVAGVVLIPGKEKAEEVTGFNSNGLPMFTEVENLVYTPYMKVETRVQFFHDLMAKHREDWLGVIAPVPQESKLAVGLPPGFSRLRVNDKDGDKPFVTCTQKVTVYVRSTVERVQSRNTQTGQNETRLVGETVIDATPATKIVPFLNRWKSADVHALEKAETGAVGRALGMAGMLVIPGTGIATAEDMQQALGQEAASAAAEAGAETAPAAEGAAARDVSAEPSHAELVALASSTVNALKEADDARYTAFLAWVQERKFGTKVGTMPDTALKELIKKAEGELEAATRAAAAVA
jgi:hypothetical protein